jgi:hypothetical protein
LKGFNERMCHHERRRYDSKPGNGGARHAQKLRQRGQKLATLIFSVLRS